MARGWAECKSYGTSLLPGESDLSEIRLEPIKYNHWVVLKLEHVEDEQRAGKMLENVGKFETSAVKKIILRY